MGLDRWEHLILLAGSRVETTLVECSLSLREGLWMGLDASDCLISYGLFLSELDGVSYFSC